MKKALSMIVTTLVALSFAGVVLAEEPAAMPAGHPPVKAEKKAKKVKKAKKAKKAEKKDEAATPATPAGK